jgi:hypothetical protein
MFNQVLLIIFDFIILLFYEHYRGIPGNLQGPLNNFLTIKSGVPTTVFLITTRIFIATYDCYDFEKYILFLGRYIIIYYYIIIIVLYCIIILLYYYYYSDIHCHI